MRQEKKEQRELNRKRALGLLGQKYSYKDIGNLLGISHQQAYLLINNKEEEIIYLRAADDKRCARCKSDLMLTKAAHVFRGTLYCTICHRAVIEAGFKECRLAQKPFEGILWDNELVLTYQEYGRKAPAPEVKPVIAEADEVSPEEIAAFKAKRQRVIESEAKTARYIEELKDPERIERARKYREELLAKAKALKYKE